MISIFTLLSLSSFIICLSLALIIYFKKVRYTYDNKLSKLFTFLCLSLAFFWAIIEFGYRQAPNFEIASNWLKINVLWYFVISFLLHFILIYTENFQLLKKKITYVIIYGPAITFFLIDIFTNFLNTKPIKEFWGWTYGIPEFPFAHSISTTWAAFTGVFCLYICLEYFLKQHNDLKRKTAKYVVVILSTPVLIAFNTEWLLPILGFRSPELFVTTTSFCLVIIGIVIWKLEPSYNKKRYDNIRYQVDKLSSKTTV